VVGESKITPFHEELGGVHCVQTSYCLHDILVIAFHNPHFLLEVAEGGIDVL